MRLETSDIPLEDGDGHCEDEEREVTSKEVSTVVTRESSWRTCPMLVIHSILSVMVVAKRRRMIRGRSLVRREVRSTVGKDGRWGTGGVGSVEI